MNRILFNDLKALGAQVGIVALEALSFGDTVEFLADALHLEPEEIQDLAQLCSEKTGGNPFFLGQFLLTLHRNGLVVFDPKRGRFTWDSAELERTPITDNVVELMGEKLRHLAPETQERLRLAACLGNRFDLRVLAQLTENDSQDGWSGLWPALQQGFVVPDISIYADGDPSTFYRFVHDRIQQAAYLLIPEAERPEVHDRVGTALLSFYDETERESHIFDIVSLRPRRASPEGDVITS